MSSTAFTSGSGTGVHVLLFPYPAQGHMLSLLDLAGRLAQKGLTITILITPQNLHLLHPLLSKTPSIKTLILPFPKSHVIPDGVENVKDLPASAFSGMMEALRDLYDPLLNWFKSTLNPPVAIISDMFLGWTHHLAVELGIPRIVFSPSGALAIAFINCLWLYVPKNPNHDPNFAVGFEQFPNNHSYPWWQISPVYRRSQQEGLQSKILKDGMCSNIVSWGYIFNSFSDLEQSYFEYLRIQLGHDRIWAVGPLLPPPNQISDSEATERGGSSSIPAEKVLTWLDSCPDNSVVYACFGSQAVLNRTQMESLAAGLEKSQCRFILCVKPATKGLSEEDYGVIPTGFEERVAGRGLVIKGWAPQVLILNHRAVTGFLSHCGWNSTLEGIMAGTVFLAWPMSADQFLNATLLVEELGVGVRVCEGANSVPDSTMVANTVAQVVGSNGSPATEKLRADKLKMAALASVKDDGSSGKALAELVEKLSNLKNSK